MLPADIISVQRSPVVERPQQWAKFVLFATMLACCLLIVDLSSR